MGKAWPLIPICQLKRPVMLKIKKELFNVASGKSSTVFGVLT